MAFILSSEVENIFFIMSGSSHNGSLTPSKHRHRNIKINLNTIMIYAVNLNTVRQSERKPLVDTLDKTTRKLIRYAVLTTHNTGG